MNYQWRHSGESILPDEYRINNYVQRSDSGQPASRTGRAGMTLGVLISIIKTNNSFLRENLKSLG